LKRRRKGLKTRRKKSRGSDTLWSISGGNSKDLDWKIGGVMLSALRFVLSVI